MRTQPSETCVWLPPCMRSVRGAPQPAAWWAPQGLYGVIGAPTVLERPALRAAAKETGASAGMVLLVDGEVSAIALE
jgi:hypothetical protein